LLPQRGLTILSISYVRSDDNPSDPLSRGEVLDLKTHRGAIVRKILDAQPSWLEFT
jgi:hypothetical protein